MKDGMAETDDDGDESELFFLQVADVTAVEMLAVGVGGVAELIASWNEDANAFTLISVFFPPLLSGTVDDALLTLTLPNSSRRASPIISEAAKALVESSAVLLFVGSSTPSSGGGEAVADAWVMVVKNNNNCLCLHARPRVSDPGQ